MNENPENFEALQKLLALKRYEQPPPGYFNRLPGQIMARLKQEDPVPAFWRQLLSGVILRPAFAYSLGLIFCGTLATGVYYAMNVQQTPQTAMQPADGYGLAATFGDQSGVNQQTPPLHVAGFSGFGTNEDGPSPQSMFNGPDLRTAPVSYPVNR